MKLARNLGVGVLCALLLVASQRSAQGQINYRWERDGNQELGARANVTVTAQGEQVGGELERQTTDQDLLFLGDNRAANEDVFGGEGGGGGASGDYGFWGDSWNGRDGVPLDGTDGAFPPFGTMWVPVEPLAAGQGGEAGHNGLASVDGTTAGTDTLNLDHQSALSYSWIHSQWGTINVRAAGGGGGGGAGAEGLWHTGWGAGNGGAGESASGSVIISQDSDVITTAVCDWLPAVTPTTPAPAIDCSITLDMGWISGANPDWSGGWQRRINMTITVGQTVVNINGGPTGQVFVTAIDDLGIPYFKASDDVLESDGGAFGLGMGEVGVTRVAPGTTATIFTPINGISSTLTGGMTAEGGQGGFRGLPIADGNFPFDGADGADGGLGLGAQGGAGGAGGIPRFLVDPWMDTHNWLGGGEGGEGGNGDHINEYKSGIYQGVVAIEMG